MARFSPSRIFTVRPGENHKFHRRVAATSKPTRKSVFWCSLPVFTAAKTGRIVFVHNMITACYAAMQILLRVLYKHENRFIENTSENKKKGGLDA
jgi:hypothetical protein